MKEKIKLHKYSLILLVFIIIKLTINVFDISLSHMTFKGLGTPINALLISCFVIIYLIETLETRANRLRYLKPAKQLYPTISQAELKSCLNDSDVRSIMINGKSGSGKTTLVESSLETKFVLRLNPFTDNIMDNYLDYLFNEVCFVNMYRYIPIIVIWLLVTIIQLLILKAVSVLMLIIGIVVTLLILNVTAARKLKQQLIINEIKTFDLIIIDDINHSLESNSEILKLVSFIHSSLTENQKLILIGDLTANLETVNKLNTYYDYRLDLANEEIKLALIDTFNIDDELVKKQMAEVTLSDLEKIKSNFQVQNISSSELKNDYLVKLVLKYHNQLTQNEIVELINEMSSSQLSENRLKVWVNKELKSNLSENQFAYMITLVNSHDEVRINVYLNH